MFYENVKKLCSEREITTWKLEEECGLGHATISKWKESNIVPNVATLQKIADYFQIELSELIK